MRKLSSQGSEQIAVRLPKELLAWIDTFAQQLGANDPFGRGVSRADVVRLALRQLRERESPVEQAPTGRQPRRKR